MAYISSYNPINAFKLRSKLPQQGNQSVYSQANANYSTNSGPAYSAPKPVQTSTPANANLSTNKGPVYVPPRTSAPKTNSPYQASGMTSAYASNPTNYTPPKVAQIQNNVQQPAQQTATDTYLKNIQARSNAQQEMVRKQQEQNKAFAEQQMALSNGALDQSGQGYKTAFNTFKENTNAGVNDVLASGERQKTSAGQYFGDAQLQAAKSRRAVQAETGRTFANLGTTDSTGEGSYARATENADSAFNSFTQNNLMQKANKLAEIDTQVQTTVRQAKLAITQEEQKMNDLLSQIETAKAQNQLDVAKGLTDQYYQSQDKIGQIQDAVNTLMYENDKQNRDMAIAKEKLNSAFSSLSDTFKTTGVPQTVNDMFFVTQYPDAYGKMADVYKNAANSGKEKTKTAAQLQIEGKAGAALRALEVVKNELFNNPLVAEQNSLPGSPGTRQYEAAVSSITDAIGGLRTGASVSPEQQKFYRNILPKFGDSPETKDYKLNAVKKELESYLQGANALPAETASIDPAVEKYLKEQGLM